MNKKGRRKIQPERLTYSEYMDAVAEEPEKYAVLPKPLIADMFGKSQAWVNKHMSDGVFEIIELGNDKERMNKFVTQRSVIEFKKKLEDEDNALASGIKKELIKCAKTKNGEKIYYSDLMDKVGLSYKVPNDRLRIGVLLGKVSEESYDKHEVMLSALAISKRTGMPSDSFFDLADDLEYESYYEFESNKEFFEAECKKIYSLAKKGKLK